MDISFLITAFVTLFVVIDPIGLAPVFIALVRDHTPQQRRNIALRACAVATIILLLFAGFGDALLGGIGISLPAFRIAGGMLLFLTALDMLFERRTQRRDDQAEQAEAADPSVFPIAIPLTAGPGAIATIILLVGQAPSTADAFGVAAVMLVVIAIVLAFFMAAGVIERVLGRTGITVATRLMGMLLAALSVQFVVDGLKAINFGL
ncbi:MAG: MarC family protein [Pseudoprimorskyibacter sp.]|jgi:multiple antibiotic resistance protein|nr:MarC family protein [Pseudoprimorskyibacter sp.]